MAEWKKVVVSGSAVSQLQNDSGYLKSGDSSVVLTGSFSGDGSGLTGITADTLGSELTEGNGIVAFSFNGSADATVTVKPDGSTLSVGANGVKVADAGITKTQLNSDVAGDGLAGGAGTALSVNTDGTTITTSGDNLTLAGTTFSSSVDSRIDAAQTQATANSASIAALDTDFATDADLTALSSSAHTARAGVASDAASATSTLSGSAHTARGVIACNVSTNAGNTTTINTAQGVQDNRLDALESFTGSLDNDFATDAELTALSSSAHTARAGVASDAASANTSLSSSFATTIGALDSIYATDASVSAVAATASADTSALSASAHTARATVASDAASANTSLSSSIATTIGTLATSATVTSLSSSVDSRLDSLEGVSHTHANKANLDAINQDLGTSDDVTFNDVVVSGDLTVSGTTTTLNTTNLLVEDKFILLNSGSADPDEGGLIIDEGAGSGHAFIYDKGDTRWGFNASVASDASTANATAHAAAVVDMQNVAHSDSTEYQKNGNIKIDSGDIFIYC